MALTNLAKYASRAAGGNPLDFGSAIVAGAAAGTAIAVAGIKASDVLLGVTEVADPGAAAGTAAMTDRTGNATVGAGTITVTVATNGTGAGARLLVQWISV